MYSDARSDRHDTIAPLGKLMHDFKCSQPQDMYYKDLADRADQLKNTEGGREEMCRIMEEISSESVRQEKYQIAIRLIKMNILSVEDIAKATDLSIEDVQALVAMVKATA
jgi:predicted transposase YdaD